MSVKRWLTPNAPPEHKQYTRLVHVPAALDFLAPISGALVDLTYPWSWEQQGDLTPEQTAEIFSGIYQQFLPFDNEPPTWETPGDLDGQPEQPWYESLSDWIIQGFLAVTFTPAAAVVYQATVPKLRVAIRTGNLGALFRVLINGVEMWSGDSYAPVVDIIDHTFDMSAETTPYTVRIEHNGVGPNINGAEAKLELIRESVVSDMVATILRADPAGCGIQWSTDNGGTWETIDLATCITGLANDAILQAVTDGVIQGGSSGQSPTNAPAPGECITYHARLAPGSKWICPSPVKEGDNIHVTNLAGGWSIGELAWYCPNGDRYLLNVCDPTLHSHVTGDLLNPGAWHMAVIGQFGSTYFDPITSVYSIPTGTAETQFFLMANTGLTGVPDGEVTFDVTVCTGQWHHSWDFGIDWQGWTAIQGTRDANGIHSVNFGAYTGCGAQRNLVRSGHVSAYRITGTWQSGSYPNNDALRGGVNSDTSFIFRWYASQVAANYDITQTGLNIPVTVNTNVVGITGWQNVHTGSCTIKTYELWGPYPDPFV